jgi:DNA-binding SARP family transcriptional activator
MTAERATGPPPVVAARVTRPEVQAVARERLDRAIAECVRHRLTLITGPAGYGKTTLLAQYVAATDVPTGWYRTEAGDGSVESLLAHIERAFRGVIPGVDGPWGSVADAAAALDGWDGPLGLLAVDDVHGLAGTPAEAALGRLIEQAPAWLRVIAACRQPPAWNLSRLRVSGDLLEIGPEQLRFRSWEVERLFCDFYGEPLPPGDLAQLARGLEGWAAGLQLFHLATRGKSTGERRRAVATLPSGSKLIREYLAENVVADLPEPLRVFLVDTAVLGHLTPRLCDELRGAEGSLAMLEALEARRVFLNRIDDDTAFRYHEAFRAHLERMLFDRDGEAATRERFARAGELLAAAGHQGEALRAHCRAENWDAVARQLHAGGEVLVDDPSRWLEALPASLLEDDPWVILATARRSVALGRWDEAHALYLRAERLFGTSRAGDICRQERGALAQWVTPSAPRATDWAGRVRAAIRGPVTPSPAPVGGSRVDVLGGALVALVHGDLLSAAAGFGILVDDEPSPATAAASLGLAVLGTIAPSIPGAITENHLDLVPELVEPVDLPWLSWLAQATEALRGEAAGRARARAVADRLERDGDPWGAAIARLFAVLRPDAADSGDDDLERLATRLVELDASILAAWTRTWHAVGLARAGHPDAGAFLDRAEQGCTTAGLTDLWAWARRQFEGLVPVDQPAAEEPLRSEVRVATEVSLPLEHVRPSRPLPADVELDLRTTGAPLVLRCLGGFSLEVAGRRVDWSGVKPRARSALHLLAVQPGSPVHIETLVDALWRDLDATAGKRNVQVALSSVRKVLDGYGSTVGTALVRRQGSAYVLHLPPGAEADVVDFHDRLDGARRSLRASDRAAAADAYEQALSRYVGDLLPEEGPAEWVVERRERFRQLAVDAARQTAGLRLALDQPRASVVACQRGLEIDRFDDALWRQLIEAQRAAGEIAAANRSRSSYEQMLAELGLEVTNLR